MAVDVENYIGGVPVVLVATDGTKLYGVLVDTDGHLQVDLLSISGYAHPDNTLFGYKDVLAEQKKSLNAPAGEYTVGGTHVPAGELWIVCNAVARNETSVISYSAIQVVIGSVVYVLKSAINAVVFCGIAWSGKAFLKEGDWIQAYWDDCVAGDDVYLEYVGYKMKV